MDAIDYKILKILQKNARETASNISKEIHLSVSAVIERIRKMEETGAVGFPFARKLMPSSDGAQERSSGPAVLNTSSFGYDTLVMPVFL